MNGLLSLVPLPYRWGAVAVLVLAAWGAWEWHGVTKFNAGVSHQQGLQKVIDAERTRLALIESEKRRAEEARTQRAQQEAIADAERKAAQARADAIIAEAASGALQRRFDERVRDLVRAVHAAADRGGQGGSPPIHSSPSAEDPARVLADVFGRCIARVRLLADLADERGRAGATCERSYDSLTSEASQ